MRIERNEYGQELGRDWLDQMFRAKSAANGGVLRRRVADVEREIGRAALELEVRRRGFHMVEFHGHFVVFCSNEPLQLIC